MEQANMTANQFKAALGEREMRNLIKWKRDAPGVIAAIARGHRARVWSEQYGTYASTKQFRWQVTNPADRTINLTGSSYTQQRAKTDAEMALNHSANSLRSTERDEEMAALHGDIADDR